LKKRIAILATYVGEVNRGAETFVIELTKRLQEEFDITVFSKGISDEIKNNIITVKFNLPFWFVLHKKNYEQNNLYRKICNRIYFLIPSEIEQYYFSKSVYKNYLLKGNYDLIFPNNGVWGARIATKMRKLNGTPFIYTGHGGSSIGEVKILNCKPEKYIALTEKYKKWAEKIYPDTLKIYNGVSIYEDNKSFDLKPEHRNLERPIILCTGAFNEMKRQNLLVDAFALMDKGTLILLGTGELETSIREYCEKKIKGKYLIAEVPYREIKYYYNLCDVFSLPSKDEPFGIVYLEAMRANKPVVSTDDEIRREIIGDCGLLCNVEDAGKYAEKLKDCLTIEWEERPLKRIKEFFDWKKIAVEYSKVINELLK